MEANVKEIQTPKYFEYKGDLCLHPITKARSIY